MYEVIRESNSIMEAFRASKSTKYPNIDVEINRSKFLEN